MHGWILNSKFRSKLEGGVLVYALFILVVVSIVLCSLILLSYFNHTTIGGFEMKDRMRINVNSGISWMLTDTSLNYNEPHYIRLYEEGNDSVCVVKTTWGLYDLIYCKAKHKNMVKEKRALCGGFYKDADSLALYLTDLNKPLCLCGNTLIRGNCMVPVAGIKRGYVDGRHYERKELVIGSVEYSDDKLKGVPQNKKRFITYEYAAENYLNNDTLIKINVQDITDDSLFNSFAHKTMVVYEPGNMLIERIKLSGNIVVFSTGNIYINPSADLKDIVLFAQKIFIEDGFEGRLQAFASDSLVVGYGCNFQYPSVVGITGTRSNPDYRQILRIHDNTVINGIVFAQCDFEDQHIKPGIFVPKNATVSGQVYSNGFIELKGKVNGSVSCNEFRLYTPSSVYINHLLDTEILYSKLPEDYTGESFTTRNKAKKIVQWLY